MTLDLSVNLIRQTVGVAESNLFHFLHYGKASRGLIRRLISLRETKQIYVELLPFFIRLHPDYNGSELAFTD